jgi:hypothetical protein
MLRVRGIDFGSQRAPFKLLNQNTDFTAGNVNDLPSTIPEAELRWDEYADDWLEPFAKCDFLSSPQNLTEDLRQVRNLSRYPHVHPASVVERCVW